MGGDDWDPNEEYVTRCIWYVKVSNVSYTVIAEREYTVWEKMFCWAYF